MTLFSKCSVLHSALWFLLNSIQVIFCQKRQIIKLFCGWRAGFHLPDKSWAPDRRMRVSDMCGQMINGEKQGVGLCASHSQSHSSNTCRTYWRITPLCAELVSASGYVLSMFVPVNTHTSRFSTGGCKAGHSFFHYQIFQTKSFCYLFWKRHI